MQLTKLKRLIDKHGVQQTEIAKIIGRDKAVVTNLLQGKRQLKAEEAIMIANYLRVPVTEVLGDLLNLSQGAPKQK